MHSDGKPDTGMRPETADTTMGKPTAKRPGGADAAEAVEERELAQGKPVGHTRVRTQRRSARHRALDRRRAAARKDRALPLTALWHQVYALNRLREAYDGVNRDASPGRDGQTWAT